MKERSSIERLLWKNFGIMIFMAFLLIAVPYFMISCVTHYYEEYKHHEIPSASERMRDDYSQIMVQDIIDKNGGITVVTGDLKVINLGGKPVFDKAALTKEEWADFLQRSGKLDVVGYNIAYNKKQDFWLILKAPVALTIEINYAANGDSPENAGVLYWLLLIVGSYLVTIGLCAVVYAKIISKRLTKPIKALCKYTQSLEQGDYQACLVDSKITEIEKLQRGLGHLAEQLSQHEKFRDDIENQRKQLVMEISHDLKNPLASIQGYSELLLNQTILSEEKQKKYLEMIHTNGIRANELLLSLFYYSQIESKDFSLNLKKENICELIRLIIAEYIPLIEEKKFILEADIPEQEYICEIDEKMMRRVFDNLLQNALKYNEQGTTISITVHLDEDQVEIRVDDNGKGIAKEEIEKIFLPFKRLDNEVRNSNNGGSGLGLAIVKKIITLHKGEITLQSDRGEGCHFIITLPAI